MKNLLKNIFLILLGAFLSFAIIVGFRLSNLLQSTHQINFPHDRFYFSGSSDRERAVFYEIKKCYEEGRIEDLNDIIKVEEREVKLIINGPQSFPSSHSPVAEILIINISDRDLVIFDPTLTKLSSESYDYGGYLQDDYSLSCPITTPSRCHIIPPDGKKSFPALFDISGTGTHKVNVSLGFFEYIELSSNNVKSSTPMIVRESFVFEILEPNAQPDI